MNQLFLIFFYLIAPLGIIYLTWRSSVAAKIGSVLIAYIIGLIIGNIGVLPQKSAEIQDLFTMISVPLALPLLLFSLKIKTWASGLGKTFVSLLLGIVSLIIPIFIGYWLFNKHIDEAWKISGMLAGVYTGGTPNLASLMLILDVKSEIYVLTHTYDMILSAVFLLFVISIGQKTLLLFLKPYKYSDLSLKSEIEKEEKPRRVEFFKDFNKVQIMKGLSAVGISILIFAIGGGLSLIVSKEASTAVAILTITSLGILASLVPRINKIEHTFDIGMYFILIFSIVVASMADFKSFSFEHLHLLLYISICVLGSFILHAIFAKIFRIDADNVIVVATALACSPPFVPVVAGALKNKEIIASGLTVGIIGYAIGNYFGYAIAMVLKHIII